MLAARFHHSLICTSFLGLAFAGFWQAGLLAPEAEAGTPRFRTAELDRTSPETIEDLKALQDQVKQVLKKVLPCTLGVRVANAQGSGVIVSKDGHVLTAGHVSGEPGQEVTLIFADGRTAKGKTLGCNRDIDSGLIKITDPGPWPFAAMGHSADLQRGQWCIAAGHPGGYKNGRSPVVRLGRILDIEEKYFRTDCTLVGGDSGGPVFDLDGKVIGIHSCIGNEITTNIHVPVDTYRETWDRLVKSEEWGKKPQASSEGRGTAFLGIHADPKSATCKIAEVDAGSPAEQAGLQVGDVIAKCNGQTITGVRSLGTLIRQKKPGDKVTLEVVRGQERLTLEVVLGTRDEAD
jgi:serine protease Do